MKTQLKTNFFTKPGRAGLITAVLLPTVSQAQTRAMIIPVEMSMTAYLIIGFLLVLSLLQFFLYQRRFVVTKRELDDVTLELGNTRNRLTETANHLDTERKAHQATTDRYTRILFEAKTGMFQMDLSGKCIYINQALQEMSGLYPKKALKEGIESAVHPEDKKAFMEAWDAFTAKDSAEFEHRFRFRTSKDRITHVICKAHKVRNAHKDVESYICWASDITQMHEEVLKKEAETGRFEHFVSETVEGFYRLEPDAPIPLGSKPEKISEKILKHMELSDCNDTFAAMYGAKPAELLGQSIGDLKDGCGPFKGTEQVRRFVDQNFQAIDVESIRQDPSGSRMNLMNNAVGIVEDNCLIGIWGYQRNISRQKRGQAELSNQVNFMRRILNTLPADVHVKDTRCRYLYASKKLADRTGIAQEEWLGKTIFEILPGTPREHDQLAIEAMKSGRLQRCERHYEVKGRKGWMENLQIPLVSTEGLVEGVVSLSLDITDRKKHVEEALRQKADLESHLAHTRNELAGSRDRNAQAAAQLAEVREKFQSLDAERRNEEARYQNQLAEQNRTMENLRRNEQGLLARQKQLEEQLAKRLNDLDAETDKRLKWEELLGIKEDELRRLEENLARIQEHYAQETTRRENAERTLSTLQESFSKARDKIAELEENRECELEQLHAKHTAALDAETSGRKKAEKKLERTQEFLESTQEQVKRLTEEHARELEDEVAERKATAEKLLTSMEELDAIRQNFSQRLDDETQAIKRELAQKQIREKALRQNEKDLEKRIKDLETTLRQKSEAYAEQIQAREGVEVEKHQIEQKMQQLTQRQQELVNRETQKLNLTIAEIRLEEVKHRKRASELEEAKEKLEEQLRVRENFLEKARQDQAKLEAELQQAQTRLKQLSGDQSKMIAAETADLQRKLEAMEKAGQDLKLKIDGLRVEKSEVEKNLETRNEELSKAAREYRKVVDAYKDVQGRLQTLSENQEALVAEKTGELKVEIKKLQRSEQMLRNRDEELQSRIKGHQDELSKLNATLQDETDHRYQAEKKLRELEVTLRSSMENADEQLKQQTRDLEHQVKQARQQENTLSTELKLAEATVKNRDEALSKLKEERKAVEQQLKETEKQLARAEREHQADLKKSMAESQELCRKNSTLVDELNGMIQDTLNPIVKTTLQLEKSSNLSREQKRQLFDANEHCRILIDAMNYRTDLTLLNAGKDTLSEQECDLHVVMTDIDQLFTQRAELNELFFAVSFAQYQAANNVPKRVVADEDKLRKTLSILLGYALYKTKKGRIGLHATREASDSESMSISFELAYTPGPGGDDLLSGIFNSEVEAVIDLKHGLTLARRYIKLLGGRTAIEFRDAGVTAVTLSLPFKRTDSEILMPKGDDNSKAGAA
ncbi:PAS domain-containing protein [Pontiella sp.]|uniref:PAS domain-containing protein n=1 Tax=Pontiella sp. TaxID=2837462 RepID=UPI003561DF64